MNSSTSDIFLKGEMSFPVGDRQERWQQAQRPAEEGETRFSSLGDSDCWP